MFTRVWISLYAGHFRMVPLGLGLIQEKPGQLAALKNP